jgi:hypothetical protein
LYNPAQTVNFTAGVHLGIFGSTRKTFVTFEDGTRETIVDTWSSGERPRIFESWWTGETHFELLVDGQGSSLPEPSPELPPVPPRLEESASSSGSRLSQDDRETSRLNIRRRDSGEDYWRVIGEARERVHVVPRTDLYTLENYELPIDFRRTLSTRET